MATHSDLIPITIWLPENELASVAMIAEKRGHKAPEEISQLVNRALHAPRRTRPPVTAQRVAQPMPAPVRPPATRAEGVSDADSIAMLSALFLGSSIEEIAARFEIPADVAASHLTYLKSVNPRSRRIPSETTELRRAS